MIKGAIIGLGKIAKSAHLPAYQTGAIQTRAAVCAAVEPDEWVRADAHQRFPSLRIYESAEELFDSEDLQFVDICTPPNLHSYMIRFALEHNVHVICEKPFALDILEAHRLAEELRQRTDIVFMPCHQYRFSPLWNGLRSFIQNRDPHEQMFIQSTVYRTASDPGVAADGIGWRRNWAVSGGGILSDTGVHYIALAEWMLGMPEEVSCRTYHLDGFGEGVVEDTAAVELIHPGGVFQFNLTWSADRRANLLHAVSPHRSFRYDGETTGALEYQNGVCRRIIGVPDPSEKAHYIGFFEKLFGEFFSMIERGSREQMHIDAALHASVVLDAAYRSARSGMVVRLGAPD
jgi:predicted dehydrogenase